ncbi:hypothetical protein V1283_004191 [Bradyrhizobium sp. AZCC 2262]|uniref:hypothetical protein n=1 Tax=Bradyrhizobium sp. AZCC 2262 TaxID=3117022 RepID=UPI002FF11819
MLNQLKQAVSLIAASVILASCGNSLWTLADGEQPPTNLDGAFLSYALAQGEVSFTAEFKDKRLTLSSDQKMTATADYNAMYRVVYGHNSFSNDDIDIQMEGALIKSLSSTTEDRSIAVVQGVTALLTQVSATQKDLEKSKSIAKMLPDAGPAAPPPCTDMTVVHQTNVTHGRGKTMTTKAGEPSCSIRFNIKLTPHLDKIMAISGFVPQETTTEDPGPFCKYVFCFRRAGLFTLEATAMLVQKADRETILSTTPPVRFDVLAPVNNALGYVKFGRRAFVKNKTVIAFSNGLVSGFTASNPSEVVGAIQLPTELLKGVSAAIVIH